MGYDLAIVTTPVAVFGLNWLVQSSVLLALGLAAGRLARGRGPALQSAVYRTTLAAVLVCPIASAFLGAAGFDGFSLRLPAPEEPPPAPVISQPIVERVEAPPNPDVALIPPSLVESPSPTADETEIDRVTAPAETEASEAVATPEVRWSWFTLANVAVIGLAAWGLGSLFLSLRLVVQQRRMRRLRAGAAPADADAEALCRAVAARMDVAAPTVWRSPFLFSPCLDGLRRPAILLPDDVDENLHDTFVHELAHLARRDGLWNLLRRLAAAVLWFQPLLWVLSRRLEATAEDVCDDYVVHFGADRARYAGLLLGFAGRALPPRSPSAVGMISLRSMLAQRVVRILDTSRALSTRAGKKAILATLALGLASTTFAGLLGVGGQPRPPEASEPTEAAPLEEARTLAADVPITGRIVDLEGRPVAGVVVSVEGVQTPKTGDVSPWIEAVRKGEPPWLANRRVEWETTPSKHKGREEKTDADGRFRLDGLEADGIVHLIVRGETIACSNLDVITRKMESIMVQGGGNRYGSGARNVHGADFTFVAAPTRPYDGVVKDAETGKPVAGVELRSYRFSGADQNAVMTLRTRSDGEGRFRMTGLPIGAGNVILLVPGEDQPYLLQEIPLPDQSAKDPATVQVAVKKGIWIEGRLTEEGTGRPISQARLYYLPFLTNTFVQGHPAFNNNGEMDGNFYQDHNLTKADGSFRLVGLPGRAIVGAEVLEGYGKGAGAEAIAGMSGEGHFATYLNPVEASRSWLTSMKEIDPPAEAKVVHVELEGFHGDSVRLRVVDGDARPLNGLTIRGRTERGSYLDGETGESNVEVSNLQPDEVRTVLFQHKVRRLGKSIRVRKGDDAMGPIVVTLEPFAQLSGRVVDDEGQPVGEATVSPFLLPYGDFTLALPQAMTTRDGKFHIPDVPIGCDYRLTINSQKPSRFALREAVAVKPGETTDVGEVRFKKEGEKATQAAQTAPADVAITGRIVDLEGRPVAGVVVKIGGVKIPKGDDLSAWIEGVKKGEPPWVVARLIDWDRKTPEVEGREAKTDADGRFRFDGLGMERVVGLSLRGETIAYTTLDVVSRKTGPIPAKGFANHNGAGSETIYGADFIYTAAPGRAVEGVVKDAKTGKPLAGAGVWSDRFAGSDFVGIHSLKTTTDAHGRFRLNGFPRGKGNALHVVPNDDQPYFMREFDLPEPEGTDPIQVDVPVHKGIWIEGAITDRETGKPVPDAWLHYLPFLSNTFAQATPEFGMGGGAHGAAHQDRYTSKADGSFRLVGLPGRAIVGAIEYQDKRVKLYMQGAGSESIAGMNKNGHFETYSNPVIAGKLWPTVMKEIDPPADATSFRVDLQPTAGDSVRVRIVAPDDRPVKPVKTIGRTSKGSYDRDDVDAAEAEVLHLHPGEERTTAFRSKERNLGKVVRVKKGDDAGGPVPVALEPLAKLTGVVVDENGDPVSGARIRTDLLPSGDFSANLEETSTDEKGRFVVPDVPTGCDYALVVESLGPNRTRKFAILKKAVLKPGQTTDVGEVRFGDEGSQAAQAPKPPAADVPITGRIVDLEGRPVASVVVKVRSVQAPNDDGLTAWIDAAKRGELEEMAAHRLQNGRPGYEFVGVPIKTDADGRFRIEALRADRVVELLLTGESIAYQTIRLVTRATTPFTAEGFMKRYGPGQTIFHGPDFTYTATPGRPIEGRIKDAQTGRPLAGVEVKSERFAGANFLGARDLETRSDADGRFRIAGMPKAKGNIIRVAPAGEQPYFAVLVHVPDPAGLEPVQVEVALHEGIWIDGELTDQRSGKPIPEARLYYFPFLSNSFSQAIPGFAQHASSGDDDRFMTKADGTFRLLGLPGRGIVGALVPERTYMQGAGSDKIAGMNSRGQFETCDNPIRPGKLWPTVMKEIDPLADAKDVHVDLQAMEGASVRLHIVGGDGQPVVGVQSEGRLSRGRSDPGFLNTAETFVSQLRPDEERTVLFRQLDGKLGKAARIRPGDDAEGPVVVKLEPLATITGRIADADGVTAPGAMIQPSSLPLGDFTPRLSVVFSDTAGRFVVPNVPIGCDYQLVIHHRRAPKSDRMVNLEKVVVKPGETTDVGEIRFGKD
ncbi:MAG: carboxypeptidase regulatory-like domain-containing protein [Paludisphaera borealis]|uniref:carboxypeptidase regulatory-like domain-containing protein n=1 Tax=Paludisphaera borealis TaxID=1387353 RepID=UPI00284E0A22|nr:carboxypeptidase regulatory-like domain-containing protein [Paludisphaera borealis]MDR3623314.1 carboxypeptidase regulatory-like domain-containing protein [Paludisphaera borealis]